MDIKNYNDITGWAKELDWVFTLSDLKVALSPAVGATLSRRVKELTDSGVFFKVKNGVYATVQASLRTICSRIDPDAYVSTGTVMAKYALIGSVPEKRLQAVRVGRPRSFNCPMGTIEYLSITPRLFFGFTSDNAIKEATPEKAFLDVCYFYYKNRRFSFNPQTDVSYRDLDNQLLKQYLSKYDARFLTFFKRIWGELND